MQLPFLFVTEQLKLACKDVFCISVALTAPGCPEVLRIAWDSFDRAHDMDAWVASGHQVVRLCGRWEF